MIPAADVCGIVVTRGDVPLGKVIAPLYGLGDVIIWNNSVQENLAVYGRYAAIEQTDKPVILVIDDDVELERESVNALLAAYEPGKIVANMPQEQRVRYTDSCLVGFGAIFDRDLPDVALDRFGECRSIAIPEEPVWHRTCDVIFTTLTPRVLVDLPFTYLPWTWAADRMYRNKDWLAERHQMLKLARKVRDA